MKDRLAQMLVVRPELSASEKLEMVAAYILGANAALVAFQDGSTTEDIGNQLDELFAENAQKINEVAA